MKYVVSVPLIAVAGALLLLPAIRRHRKPFEHIQVHPSARDYWVSFDEENGGELRHPGAAWPLPDYEGESGVLWKLRPPGINQTFLVLRLPAGAYNAQTYIWLIRSSTDLVLVGDLSSVGELLGNSEGELQSLLFEDVDGDGVEELRQPNREYVRDDENEDLDGWAIETRYHRWTGAGFEARWKRLRAFDVLGPLTAMNP